MTKTQNKHLSYIVFTYDGASFPIAKRLIDEGNEVIVCQIENREDVGVDSWVSEENEKEKKLRFSLYDGIITKFPLKKVLKVMEEIQDKENYFIIFDFNTLYKIAEKVLSMGFTKGLFPTEEDFNRENERQDSKEFVKKYYQHLVVAETKEMKGVDEVIKFLQESDKLWVVKSDGNFGETLVPNSDNVELAVKEMVNELENGKEDYNKGNLILEEKIVDAIEFAPEMVFWDGKPIYSEVEIETRMLGSGDTGPQTGGNQNIVIHTSPNDLINKLFFPNIIYDIAKNHKGLFIFDAGILSDGEDYYFTEFAGNRWGWGGVFSELSGAESEGKNASNYFESVSRGEDPYKHQFSANIAVYGLNSTKDASIIVNKDNEMNTFLYQIKKGESKESDMTQYIGISYRDYGSAPLGYITGYGDSLEEAVASVYESVKNFTMKGVYYRPQEDFLSTGYTSSIVNRYNFLIEKGLIKKPEGYVIDSSKNEMRYLSDTLREHTKITRKSINKLTATVENVMAMTGNIKIPEYPKIDMEPLREEISSLKIALKPKDTSFDHNRLIDAITTGFKSSEFAYKANNNKELIAAFYDAIQPLIDQNVEKLEIMKKKQKSDGKQDIMVGSSISSVTIRGYGIVKTGRTTSTSIGTGVQLTATPTPCRRVDITALKGNTNYVYIGDKNVLATAGSEIGNILFPTNTVSLSISDASLVYFDVLTSSDGISWTVFN